jgi:hypothetical protein
MQPPKYPHTQSRMSPVQPRLLPKDPNAVTLRVMPRSTLGITISKDAPYTVLGVHSLMDMFGVRQGNPGYVDDTLLSLYVCMSVGIIPASGPISSPFPAVLLHCLELFCFTDCASAALLYRFALYLPLALYICLSACYWTKCCCMCRYPPSTLPSIHRYLNIALETGEPHAMQLQLCYSLHTAN